MKIIIEIPKETYEYWKTRKCEYVLAEAISNGKVIENEDNLEGIRPKGEWVEKHDKTSFWYECNQCGKRPLHLVFTDFCPNCGADMRGYNDNKEN